MTGSDLEELRSLEESLWRPQTRQSAEWMDRILAEDFVEFGASGCLYSREEVLRPTSGTLDEAPELLLFSAKLIAPGVGLVTYVSAQRLADGTVRSARRSSLWRHEDKGWKLVFHQGTLITPHPPDVT